MRSGISDASALSHRKIPIVYGNQEMERVPLSRGYFRPTKGELRAMMDDENLILRKFVGHLCSIKNLRDDGFIKHELP